MDLTGRYIKVVVDDSSIKHYPCNLGDYMLFTNKYNDVEEWGDFSNNHDKISPRYWGTDVHKDKRFQLMPVGFHPNNIEPTYDIY